MTGAMARGQVHRRAVAAAAVSRTDSRPEEMAADSAGAAGGLKGASRKGAVIDPTSLSVRSVALVTSLPKDLCAVTLAHEFGHVFLHLSGIATPAMSDRAAEGLCELFSYLWEHCHLVGEGDEAQRRLRRMRTWRRARMSSTAMASGMPSPRIVPATPPSRIAGADRARAEAIKVLPGADATEQLATWAKRGARFWWPAAIRPDVQAG